LSGLLNGGSIAAIYNGILINKKNPNALITIYRGEILVTTIGSIIIFNSGLDVITIVTPIVSLCGIYLIVTYGYLYDQINTDEENQNDQAFLSNRVKTTLSAICYASASAISIATKDLMIVFLIKQHVSISIIIQCYFTFSFLSLLTYQYYITGQIAPVFIRDLPDNSPEFVWPFTFISSAILYLVYYISLFKLYTIYNNIGYIKTMMLSNMALVSLLSKFVFQYTELYDKQCIGIVLLYAAPVLLILSGDMPKDAYILTFNVSVEKYFNEFTN